MWTTAAAQNGRSESDFSGLIFGTIIKMVRYWLGMDIGVGSYINSKSLNELNFIIVQSSIYILFRGVAFSASICGAVQQCPRKDKDVAFLVPYHCP